LEKELRYLDPEDYNSLPLYYRVLFFLSYSHLFLPQNADQLEALKRDVEATYARLEKLTQMTGSAA